MKVVILNSKSGQQDLYTYGKNLLEKLRHEYNVVMYDVVKPDFSNIPELFDSEEKLVLFNQFAIPKEGFSAFTKYLPTFKNIRYILSPYSAYEGLDLDLLKKLNIRYRNNGGANSNSIAQYAITAMFMLLGKFPELGSAKTMPTGSILGEEYQTKTAGIVGLGNVGSALLKTLQKLGITTVFYDRKPKNISAQQVSLSDVFAQNIVFITIATNAETQKLLASVDQLIQPHNYLIDISAADDLYDKQKIVDLLNGDKLKGYALEIFDPGGFILKSAKNFIATPHIAWCTFDAEKRTVENYLNRALKILQGNTEAIDFII